MQEAITANHAIGYNDVKNISDAHKDILHQ